MPTLSVPNTAKHFAAHDTLVNSSGSVSISGPTFFSYAEPIAKKSMDRKLAWVTSKRFSTTTSKHTSYVHGALLREGWTVLTGPKCPETQADWDALLDTAHAAPLKIEPRKFPIVRPNPKF